MTDRPTTPAPAARAKRPTIKNADVPSDTLGLPGVGEGASATHYARDLTGAQQNDGDEELDAHAHLPGDPGDRAG